MEKVLNKKIEENLSLTQAEENLSLTQADTKV
jgi:hypothetical protein